jgi:hypothetical protein
MRATLIILFMSCFLIGSQCQRSDKLPRYFGDAIWTDSTSTLFIPVLYSEGLASTNKIAAWGDYYANLVVYNFQQDSYKKLFAKDTYITGFHETPFYDGHRSNRSNNITSKWIFMLVKHSDYNESGRVDSKDPAILFACTLKGDSLKQITNDAENVISFKIHEKQGFALLRLQRDSDGDGYFKEEDKEFYFRKISLTDLSLGKPIELN